MNFAGLSPVAGNGNDSGRRLPRSQDTAASGGSNMTPNETRQTHNYKYLVADELQKLRDSSHHAQRGERSLDTESEHNGIIKGLLYPGIEQNEDEDDDIDDFFEEDYQMAQANVNPSVVRGIIPNRSQMMDIDRHTNNMDTTDSQRSRHRLRLGNEFTDLVGEKTRR
ncbi:unnamed protein product [Cylindrotheca closterium]|uniref:Uncharacterized protein n=1 Tax=Cylindrotheca closterium TaxID=2856 RepID=A0AAD2G0X5_9STRA|nr:unnamed protein product [Cylindrotheca closterium]